MPAQTLAAVATLLSFAPHGNRLELTLDQGAAELVWLSPTTFHYRRTLEGPLVPSAESRAAVQSQIDDTPGAIRVRTQAIEVTIQKHGLLLRVRRADGAPLMTDLTEPRASGAGVEWDRQTLTGVRYYGLGPRESTTFDLRGKVQAADAPFLYSTAGCAEFHPTAGAYRFDFTADDRVRIHAPAVDYYFYYGPRLKQTLEAHGNMRGVPLPWNASSDRFGSWAVLRSTLLRVVQGGISGMIAPTLDLSPYASAPPELLLRARQLGSLVSAVTPGPVGLSDFRKQLEGFFTVYGSEMREKGYPVWHPLPFQFPDDPECAMHADEFLLGDEMLIAPIVEPGGKRKVYLPQGEWTNLETNEAIAGRRTIDVETKSLPVFARNGTIVPLNSGVAIVLHYFPKLGAEFFLYEQDADAWTQIHAAPAADVTRLEIESKVTRDYQWVIHHVERPAEVGFESKQFAEVKGALMDEAWRYDAAQRNLQIRLRVAGGEDRIVNLVFP